ncbi:SIR2 family protein [Morganella morganii]|uniref:SIR2 family protein n=1 Tax=Morganella morganii TaxID=582 RepID=UPI00339CFE78
MIDNKISDEKLSIKKRSVKDLADYIKIRSGNSPNYSLFLGAGASVTSGIRTGYELVQEWREEIYKRFSGELYSSQENAVEYLSRNHPDWYDQSNEYSSLFEKKFDLPSQRRRFVELQVDKKLPSIGYAYLVELFEMNFFDTIFTTNFDDLINEAFYQFSSDRPLLCAHDSSIKGISITSSRPKIIKLHGDYLFDNIKSSLRETESLESNTREKLSEFTKEYGMIFVGYAGNDNSIMDVLKYILKQDDYLKNGIYWCKRRGDKISPELFKLLNNERVYWVEIDGFDEFMAELVHELGCELSLSGAQKSTKRERMIHNFIKDEYSLSDNELIKNDLLKLKRHTLTQDISSLINELSDEDDRSQKIPEEDFKNLLLVDNLIRGNKYDLAEDKLNKLIKNAVIDSMKAKYLQRIIDIKEEQGDTKSALDFSDKLIELDEYNLNYTLARTNIFIDIKDKINYLKGLLEKFKYSIDLKNNLCRLAINYLEVGDEELISFSDVYSYIEESLKRDNSLDNRAWRIKYEAIKCQYLENHDKKERNNIINKLLDDIKTINPIHDTYLYIYSSHVSDSRNKKAMFECISVLSDVYNVSSKNKRKNILKYLSRLHMGLFESDDDKDGEDDIYNIMSEFINKYSKDKEESSIAPFIIFKARYEIGYHKNIEAGLSLAKDAMDSLWRNNHIQSISDILLIDKNNIPLVEDFIDNLPKDTSSVVKLKIKSDILVYKKDFKSAIDLIEEAYKKKWDYSHYILAKVYTNLLAKNYNEVIKIVDGSINKIKDVREKDVLMINRSLAKKELGQEINKHEILSIIAHNQSKGEVAMCAFFILSDELQANRQLKICIERDYMNYFRFSEWPVLPENILDEYKI